MKTGAVTSPLTVNDDRLAVFYDVLEATLEKRYSRGWTVLGGYTYSLTRQDLSGLNNPNNVFVNAEGESGGRGHQLKINGSYTLPWQIVSGVEYRVQSGLPITRSLVKAHGGEIRLDSALGSGAAFYVTLPIQTNLALGEQEI